jgi:hypothetical protein
MAGDGARSGGGGEACGGGTGDNQRESKDANNEFHEINLSKCCDYEKFNRSSLSGHVHSLVALRAAATAAPAMTIERAKMRTMSFTIGYPLEKYVLTETVPSGPVECYPKSCT